MQTTETSRSLAHLFSELTEGVTSRLGGFILNTGDIGLLRSLDTLTADEASEATNDGATIAAHAQHLRYGLSLMNRWVVEGGNPFADAKWDEAWKVSDVDEPRWEEIRNGLRDEAQRWRLVLSAPREVTGVEFSGMVGSIAHLAYHLGAIRQINKRREGRRKEPFSGAHRGVWFRTYSSTFLASTSSGTLPPSTTVSLNAFTSNFAPSAVIALSRCRLISLWPTL